MASSSSPSPSASPPHPPPGPSQSRSPSPSLSPKHEPLLAPAPESKSISPPKKSPPLPWTHQETLALIQAYQEKWYSLKKGQLKAFQWEEVAVTVAARCGFDEPSKTATQCRHKIEKLRKRYRSELQKPYPNSWQYFEHMDQMERGPMPLSARPFTVAKSFSNNASSNSNNISNSSHGYGNLYPISSDYYNNDSRGDGGGSDDSDEKWKPSHGVEAATRNKSKSINNIVRGGVKSGVRSAKRMAMERGFGGVSSRGERVLRNPVNGKRKQYYDGDDSDDDDDDDEDEDDDDADDDDEDDVEEEEQVQVEEREEGGAGTELAAEIRGFTERFMGMENKKIEMMRATERYRMEMEKKRMDMIREAQRKIVDTIGRAFGAHKKAKTAQET